MHQRAVFLSAREKRMAFTLVELLVVIAVIAVLSVVVILSLNPAELLRQSRDGNRISDMASLSEAFGLFSEDQSTGNIGSSSVIYVSIPDPAATSTAGDQCQGLGLMSLPGTGSYSYHCASTSTYRNTNGTGWIPIDLALITSGSPLAVLPVDPTNSSSSRLYYTYSTNGSQYELTAAMESQKYKLGGSNDVVSGDGGTLATVYERGTKLGLEPLDYGDASLLGYWTFEEGSSSIAYDYSGDNATGSWNGSAVGTNGYYSAGEIGSDAGTFDGATTYISNSANNSFFNLSTGITLVAWVKLNASSTDEKVISKRPSYALAVYSNNIPETEIFISGTSHDTRSAGGGTTLVNGRWYQIAGTYNGTTLTTYVNGVLDRQISVSGSVDTTAFALNIGKTADSSGNYWNGLIDDARVYSRALSASEIAALYNASK